MARATYTALMGLHGRLPQGESLFQPQCRQGARRSVGPDGSPQKPIDVTHLTAFDRGPTQPREPLTGDQHRALCSRGGRGDCPAALPTVHLRQGTRNRSRRAGRPRPPLEPTAFQEVQPSAASATRRGDPVRHCSQENPAPESRGKRHANSTHARQPRRRNQRQRHPEKQSNALACFLAPSVTNRIRGQTRRDFENS